MRRFIVAIILLGLTATVAQATVVNGTFSGVVTWGSDPSNYYGLGGNLVGQTVTGTFSYDSAAFPTTFPNFTTDGATYNYSWVVYPTIPMTITETLNHIATTFVATLSASIDVQQNYRTPDEGPNSILTLSVDSNSNVTTLWLVSPKATDTWLSNINDLGSANFSRDLSDHGSGITIIPTAELFSPAEFFFTPTFASAGPASTTVPEPMALALLGVGLAGFGVIRRRLAKPYPNSITILPNGPRSRCARAAGSSARG